MIDILTVPTDQEFYTRFPETKGAIDYRAFRAALDALYEAEEEYHLHPGHFVTDYHPEPDFHDWQGAIEKRLPTVPEPARTWLRYYAGIMED